MGIVELDHSALTVIHGRTKIPQNSSPPSVFPTMPEICVPVSNYIDFGTQAHCVPDPIAARNVSLLEQTGLSWRAGKRREGRFSDAGGPHEPF
jgi:hypothetical protein